MLCESTFLTAHQQTVHELVHEDASSSVTEAATDNSCE